MSRPVGAVRRLADWAGSMFGFIERLWRARLERRAREIELHDAMHRNDGPAFERLLAG